MKKLYKISFLLIVMCFLFLFMHSVYAVDMNLNTNSTNTVTNSIPSNTTTNTSVSDNTTSPLDLSNITGGEQGQSPISDSSANVSLTNNLSTSGPELGLTNILNILVIAVGIILIFLGITILIRMNK